MPIFSGRAKTKDRSEISESVSVTAPSRLSVKQLQSDLAGPFDMALPAGGCAVITGASGSGKSLFLRMVADLDPCRGEVRLDGRDRAQVPAPQWRSSVTYVAAEAGWWTERVADHFPADRLDRAQALARRMGLAPDLFTAEVRRLSTGEKQRLALARAFCIDRPVLLLDEPTGALDQPSVALVEAVLRARLAEGGAIVMVTHDEPLGQRLGGQHFRMADRRMTPVAAPAP